MELKLNKKPKSPTIIHGFPGVGLVGSIASNFLIEHLQAEKIGSIESQDITPIAAIHNEEVVEPLGIYYNKKYNLILFRTTANITGLEWKVAKMISKLAKEVKAKEIISLEGVASQTPTKDSSAYFYTGLTTKQKQFEKLGIQKLKEGIILGTTGALLLNQKLPITCILAETHTKLPDSRAAAKIIEIIDSYLNLKVDPKPLVKKAEDFEDKLKEIMSQSKKAVEVKAKKEDLNYLG